MKSKVCSVDLDGVLNYYPSCWLDFINDRLGLSFRNKEDARRDLGSERYERLKHEYRTSDFKANLKARPMGIRFVRELKRLGYFVIVVTERPFGEYPGMYGMTEAWLRKNNVPFDRLMSKKDLVNEKVDFHVDDEPFFTVCIETCNRGKTIFDTLASVALQSFRNFDVTIVDNHSTDNTVSEVQRFFLSEVFRDHPFVHVFRENYTHLEGLRNWNEPLKLAKGKYIALLEGDDEYAPSHLEEAYRTIMSSPDLGIYTVNNQHARNFNETYLVKNVATPSEIVFIRENDEHEPYLFDVERYGFCPEVALQLDILYDGYHAFHNPAKQVFRHPSSHESPLTRYIDYFKITGRYKDCVPKNLYHEALKLNLKRLLQYLMYFPLRYVQVKWRHRDE